MICSNPLQVKVSQEISGGTWIANYPYLYGDYVCDTVGRVYFVNDGVLASAIDVVSYANEKWPKAYTQLNYPDFKCKPITPPLPSTYQAKNYADLVVFDSAIGSYVVIPVGTLALYSDRCFSCVQDCANWQPGNELYWKLTDYVCTLIQSVASTFTA